MAHYLYFCNQCQKQFEIEKPMAQAADDACCPDCNVAAHRIFTAPAMHVKHSGCSDSSAGCCTDCRQGSCHRQ